MGEFFVYSGYVGPDCHDASEGPIYTLNKMYSKEQVSTFRQAFEEETANDECSNVIFQVIEGFERKIVPIEKVVNFDLV